MQNTREPFTEEEEISHIPEANLGKSGVKVKCEDRIKEVGVKFLKNLTTKLLSGYSFTEIVFPAQTLSHLTQADISLLEVGFLLPFITKAAREEDKTERIKLITTAVVSHLTSILRLLKGHMQVPVPIGATAQASTSDGSQIYFEHVGPLKKDSRMYAVGPDNLYTLYTTSRVEKLFF